MKKDLNLTTIIVFGIWGYSLSDSAICILFYLTYTLGGWVMLEAVLLHDTISFDRIRWLLQQK